MREREKLRMTRHPVGMALSILAVVSIACFLMIGGIPGTDATKQTEGDFKFTVTDDVATIIGYTGTANDLTVPSQLGGKDVVAIAGSVFAENTNLKNVTIPSTVTSIELRTFVGCTSLESVSLPTNLTELGSSAFEGCTSLKTVTIPASLTEIGSDAFSGCTSLGTVAFAPGSVLERICDGAFMDCVKLDGIVLPSTLKYLESSSYYATGSVFKGCASLSSIAIPDGVTELGDYTFEGCTNLTSVSIGENSVITYMGKSTFKDCTSLKTAYIPKNVGGSPQYIQGSMFEGCDSLTSISVHPDSTLYTAIDGILFSMTSTTVEGVTTYTANNIIKYPAAKSGTSYTASADVTSVNTSAFSDCILLETIDLSATSITNLNSGVFNACTALTTVKLPITIRTIADTAFMDCDSIAEFEIPEGNDYFSTLDGVLFNETKSQIVRYPIAKTGTEFSLPENTKNIKAGAFQGCSELTVIYVTGPIGTMSIGEGAFADCNAALTTLANGRTACTDLALYSDSAFKNEIADIKTFSGTAYLKWDAETAVGGTTFTHEITYTSTGGAKLLKYGGTEKDIVIPSSVGGADLVELAEQLFYNNTDITSVVIPDTVTTIGESIFSGCTSLASATLPAALETIPGYMFANCSSLASIDLPETLVEIGETSFMSTALVTLDIPKTVYEIGGHSFNGCKSLKTVTFETGSVLYVLGEKAFYDCTALETINLPSTTRSLGIGALQECSSLTGTFVIPAAHTVPNNFLTGCKSLTKIVVSDGTAKLNYEALMGCSSVTELTLPGTLSEMGSKAVASMDSLKTVTITANSVVHFVVMDNILYELDDSTGTPYEMRLYPCQDPRESYTVPAGVKWIDDYAMIDNPYLKTLTLPASIDTVAPSVNDWFLNGFESLENIYLNGENEHFQSVDGILFSKDGTVLVKYPAMHKVGGVAITSYTVPSEVDMILDYAFEYVGLLEEVFISDAVTTLDICTFQNSTSLKEVTLGDGVSTVLDSSFSACSSLETIFISFPSSNTRTILVSLLEVGVMTNSDIIKPESGTGTILMTYPEWVGGDEKYEVVYTLSIGDYTISFDPNGGTGAMNDVDVPVGGSVALPANTFTYEKMDFTGWNTKADGSGSGYSDGQTVSGLSETAGSTVTLYAQWKVNQYTVTYKVDGIQVGNIETYDYGETVDIRDPYVKTGYTVSAWSRTADFAMPAEDVVITATSTINKYTLTFDTAGGSAIPAITQDYGTAVTAPSDPTRTGYVFAGWDKTIPSTMPAENMTFTAQWSSSDSYTIAFDSNGGTGAMDDAAAEIGKSMNLPASSFTRTGYTFDGWNTEADGSGTSYADGQNVGGLSETAGSTVTLYAQWKVNQYTITFDTNGGNTLFPLTQDYGTIIDVTAIPVKEGEIFAGWSPKLPATMPAYDMTVEAIWATVLVEPTPEGSVTTMTDETGTVTTVITKENAKEPIVITTLEPVTNGDDLMVKDESIDTAVGQIENRPTGSEDADPVIDVPVGEKNAASVSSGSMSDISDAGASLKISGTTGTIMLDKDVCRTLSSAEGDVRISIDESDGTGLTEKQRQNIGDRPAFILKAQSGSGYHHELGGTATATLPYVPLPGEDVSKLRVFHVNDDGDRELIDSEYDSASGMMKMRTTHFSVFVIDTAEDESSGGMDMTLIIAGVVAAIAVIAVVAAVYLKSKA